MIIQNIATKKIIQNFSKEKFDGMDKAIKLLYKILSNEDEKEIEVKNTNTKNEK